MNQSEDKEIRVYGTLVNNTVDSEIGENVVNDKHQHNDALAYAKQLYDDKFGESVKVNNFQDVINKRVKGISRKEDAPVGTIVDSLYLPEGKIYIPNGQGGWVAIDLTNLQQLWKVDGDGKLVPTVETREVKARGFYDTSVN